MVELEAEQWSAYLAALLAAVRPRCTRLFRAYGIPEPDGEDLVQDAMVRLVMKWREIEDPRGWLLGAVRNLCRKHVRREKVRSKTVRTTPQELERLAGAVADTREERDALADVARLAPALSPRQRRLLRLALGLGCNAHELAAALGGARPASLRRTRGRAVARLRELLTGGR